MKTQLNQSTSSNFKGQETSRENLIFYRLDGFWTAVYPQRELSVKGSAASTDE